MTVLADHEIAGYGAELVDPYNRHQVSPASYDVQLGGEFLTFEDSDPVEDLQAPAGPMTRVAPGRRGFALHPGEMVLGHTVELVTIPTDIVARIEGKSSLGRRGLAVHVTAGFIDPGFHGRVTLEMVNLRRVPIILRPGRLVAQLSFHRLSAACQTPYAGRYQGNETVTGAR